MIRFVHRFSPRIAFRAQGQAWLAPRLPRVPYPPTMANKRKRSSGLTAASDVVSSNTDQLRNRRTAVPLPANVARQEPQPPRRQPSRAGNSANTNPKANILDGISSLRASPDGGEFTGVGSGVKPRRDNSGRADKFANAGPGTQKATPAAPYATTEDNSTIASAHAAEEHGRSQGPAARTGAGVRRNTTEALPETAAADLPDRPPGRNKRRKDPSQHVKVDSAETNNTPVNAASKDVTLPPRDAVEQDVGVTVDPEEGPTGEEDEEEVKEAHSRPSPVNSDYLPLPWKGRLGYVRCPPTSTLHLPLKLTGNDRPVSTPTFATLTHPSSVLERAV